MEYNMKYIIKIYILYRKFVLIWHCMTDRMGIIRQKGGLETVLTMDCRLGMKEV
jgi:hypothetical protein